MEAVQSAGAPKFVIVSSYMLVSLSITILFYYFASASGRHSSVELGFGAAWTFLLSLIVSASILPGLLRKIYGRGKGEAPT